MRNFAPADRTPSEPLRQIGSCGRRSYNAAMGPLVAAALVLALEPARLVQQTPAATARVHVIDSATPPARKLHLWCSTGNISEALDLGSGRWDAIYSAPSTGRPQYAVIAAWDEESGTATA